MPVDCGIPFSDSDFFISRVQNSSYPRLLFPQACGETDSFIHGTKKSKFSFFPRHGGCRSNLRLGRRRARGRATVWVIYMVRGQSYGARSNIMVQGHYVVRVKVNHGPKSCSTQALEGGEWSLHAPAVLTSGNTRGGWMSATANLAVREKREISFPLPASETRIVQPVRSSPAFLKLWSADHKWSSGSALVVLLDWTLVQKRQKK